MADYSQGIATGVGGYTLGLPGAAAGWFGFGGKSKPQGPGIEPNTGERYSVDQSGNYFDQNGQQITETDRLRELQEFDMRTAAGPGQPNDPGFQSAAPGGVLDKNYWMDPNAYNVGNVAPGAGYKAFQDRALSTGYSPWVDLQTRSLRDEASKSLQDIQSQSQGQAATAQANLARSGGLSTGARERIQKDATKNAIFAGQGVRSGLQQSIWGTQAGDIQSSQAMLPQFASMENQLDQYNAGLQSQNAGRQASIQQGNIGRAYGELGAQRGYEQNKYNQGMNIWAADRLARQQMVANS